MYLAHKQHYSHMIHDLPCRLCAASFAISIGRYPLPTVPIVDDSFGCTMDDDDDDESCVVFILERCCDDCDDALGCC